MSKMCAFLDDGALVGKRYKQYISKDEMSGLRKEREKGRSQGKIPIKSHNTCQRTLISLL